MSKKPYRTNHQREIMGIVLRKAGEGVYLTIKELHGLISYGASYGAVRKSLAALEGQDMILRQPKGRNTYILPTQRGYDWFRPKKV